MARDLLDYWVESRYWIDIAGVNYKEQGGYDSHYYMNFQSGRKELLNYLRTCETGQWYTVNSLLRTIKQEKPYLLRRSYQSGVAGYRDTKTILDKWFLIDGEILVGMLSSSLYEMGIVALGYEEHQSSQNGSHPDSPATVGKHASPTNPVAFMVTELGAAALATKNDAKRALAESPLFAEAHEQKPTLIVQPNFELMLLQPDMPTLYRLLPFAQIVQVASLAA
jgi:hypothetical protein